MIDDSARVGLTHKTWTFFVEAGAIRAIQELVREHEAKISALVRFPEFSSSPQICRMPTEFVKSLMKECQKAFDSKPKLYKLTWTMVDFDIFFARVGLTHKTQTLILEAVDHLPDSEYGGKIQAMEMPDRGMVLASWVEKSMPFVMYNGEDTIFVIHSIVPYELYNRAHEEWMELILNVCGGATRSSLLFSGSHNR